MSDIKFTEFYQEHRRLNTLQLGIPPEETLVSEQCKESHYLEHLFQTLSSDGHFVNPKLVPVFKPDDTFTPDIFASYVALTNNKKQKTKQKKNQDKNSLEFLGLTSPERDLETLLNLQRFSIKRPVIATTLANNQITKQMQTLLLYLAEHEFLDNSKPDVLSIKFNETFQQSDPQMSAQLRKVKYELQLLDTKEESDQILEIFLLDNQHVKEVLEFPHTSKPKQSSDHLELDLICRSVSKRSKSATVQVQLACLTGNVTYLLTAINLLLDDNKQTLKTTSTMLNGLKSFNNIEDYMKNPLHLQLSARKVDLGIQHQDRVLHLATKDRRVYYNTTKSQVEIEVVADGSIEIVLPPTGMQVLMSFVKFKDNVYSSQQLLFMYFYKIQDENRKIVDYKILNDLEQKTKSLDDFSNQQKSILNKIVDLLRSILKESEILFIRQWVNQQNNTECVSLITENIQDNQKLSVLQTYEIMSKQCWTIKFKRSVVGFDILEGIQHAAILFKEQTADQLELYPLFGGQNKTSLDTNDVYHFNSSEKVGVKNFKLSDPRKPDDYISNIFFSETKAKKQIDFTGEYQWNFEGNEDFITILQDGKVKWSFNGEGTWKNVPGKAGQIEIQNEKRSFKLALSECGYLLEPVEEKDKIKLQVQRYSYLPKQKIRSLDQKVTCGQLKLINDNDLTIQAQFDVRGGGTGREYACNLIDPKQSNWNKWCATNCASSESLILYDFKNEIDFDGFCFITANDCAHRDPLIAEIHILTPLNNWKYLGSLQLSLSAQRHCKHNFAFTQPIRAKAIVFNLVGEPRRNQGELQLGSILILQDPSRFDVVKQNSFESRYKLQIKENKPDSIHLGNFVQNSNTGQGYEIDLVDFPINSSIVLQQEQAIFQERSKEFFGFEKPKKLVSKFNSENHALLLAKYIGYHSHCSQYEKTKNSITCWLHLSPTLHYFQAIYELFVKKNASQLLLGHLSQNLLDNLGVFCHFKDVELPKLMGKSNFMKLMNSHVKLNYQAINYYRRASEYKQKPLKSFLEEYSVRDANENLISKNLYMREKLNQIAQGSIDQFEELWVSLSNQTDQTQLVALLLALGCNIKKELPFKTLKLLRDSLEYKSYSLSVKRKIRWVIMQQIQKTYLNPEKLTKNVHYDHKGFLVTQSELLSGGIAPKYQTIFSQEAQLQIKNCFELIGDEELSNSIADFRNQNSENLIINTMQKNKNDFSFSIIHQGDNHKVDEIIQALQQTLVKKESQAAQLGKEIGMKLVRSAFAVMVKLHSESNTQFQNLLDDLELVDGIDIPEKLGDERTQSIEEFCQQQENFKRLLQMWSCANRMRNWLSVKKQSVSLKYAKRQEENQDDQQEVQHLEHIYKEIVEKAELLIKIEPPKQQLKTAINLEVLTRKPSYIPPKSATIQSNHRNQTVQSTGQQFVSNTETSHKDALVSSVLACLQSPVLAVEIKNQIEISYIEAVKRLTGLTLIRRFQNQNETQSEWDAVEIVDALFILQKSGETLTHYLDGITGGCNLELEKKIREAFFDLLHILAERLVETENPEEAFTLLYGLQWGYQARDFDQLVKKIDIFNVITKGKSLNSQISLNWGKISPMNPSFAQDLVLSFKDIFFTVLARVSDPKFENQTQLKTFGNENVINTVPKLVKRRSQVDENSSSLLLDSAFRAIFRYFDSFIIHKKMLDEIPHTHELVQHYAKNEEIALEKMQNFFENPLQESNDQPVELEQIIIDTIDTKEQEPNVESNFWNTFANIDVQLNDPSKSPKQSVSTESEKAKQKKVIEPDVAKQMIVQEFLEESQSKNLGELFDCVKMFSSVSRLSKQTAQLMKSIASPYYVRTLLQLLLSVTSEFKLNILSVLEDLIEIDPVLFNFQDQGIQLIETEEIFGSSFSNFIYSFVKMSIDQNEIQCIEVCMRILRKLQIKDQLEQRISSLASLQPIDQLLTLKLCNYGSELVCPLPGQRVKLLTRDVSLSCQFFIVVRYEDQTCQVYDEHQNKIKKHHISEIQVVNTDIPICKVPNQLMVDIIRSNNTVDIVKVALINALIKNTYELKEQIKELQEYFGDYLVQNYVDYVERREKQENKETISYFTDEIESLAFLNIKNELIKPPKAKKSDLVDQPIKSRSLIKTLYRPKEKNSNMRNPPKVYAYYDLFVVNDSLYHLKEDAHMKADYLKKLLEDKRIFPMSNMAYQKLLGGKARQRVRCLYNTWNNPEKLKLTLQKSVPILYKQPFKSNFKYLLSDEVFAKISKAEKPPKIFMNESDLLLFQRISQLLFLTYEPSKEIADDETLWHLNNYYLQRCLYYHNRSLSARELTKRWLQIVSRCDVQWQEKYILRSIRQVYKDANLIQESDDYDPDYFLLKSRPLRIIYKLLQLNYEHFAEKVIDHFVEVILRLCLSTKLRDKTLQSANRKHLNLIQKTLTLIRDHKDIKVLKQLQENKLFKEFMVQSCKKEKLYQFTYVGQQIFKQITDLERQLEINFFEPEQFQNKQMQRICEFESVVSDSKKMLPFLVQKYNVSGTSGNYINVAKEQFDSWVKVQDAKIETTSSTFNLKVKIQGGSGYGLLAVSSEPQLNGQTQYKIVKAGQSSQIISFDVSSSKSIYIKYPVDKNFIANFKCLRLNQDFDQRPFAAINTHNDFKLICFEATYRDKNCHLFALQDSGENLFYAKNDGQFKKVNGINGKVKQVLQPNLDKRNKIIIIDERNWPYSLDVKMKESKKESKCYYKSEQMSEKVYITVESFEKQGQLYTFQAQTIDGQPVTVIGEKIIDDDIAVKIFIDQQTPIEIGAKISKINKSYIFKAKGLYIESSVNDDKLTAKQTLKFMEKELQEKQIDVIKYVDTMFGIVAGKKFYLCTTDKIEAFCNMPNQVEKISQFHFLDFIDSNTLMILFETVNEQSKKCLYIAKEPDGTEEPRWELEVKFLQNNNFRTIYSNPTIADFALAIDEEGEIWTVKDKENMFTPEREESEESLFQKTNIMSQRMSKAVDVKLISTVWIKAPHLIKDPPHIQDDAGQIALLIQRIKQQYPNHDEESFEVVSQKDWSGPNWQSAFAFDLTQLYYIENRPIQSNNFRQLLIKSESILMSNQFFVLQPNVQDLESLSYYVLDPKNQIFQLENDTLEITKQFLSTELMKSIKMKALRKQVFKHKKSLRSLINEHIPDKQGFDPYLIEILIAANQLILDNIDFVRAVAHDFKFSSIDQFLSFADTYILPQVYYLIIYKVQKTIRPHKMYFERTVKFDRLNSEDSLFDQLYKQTSHISTKIFTFKRDPERPFRSRFIGENAYDAGGPFRDVMEDICTEITEVFLKSTSNNAGLGDSSYEPRLLTDTISLQKFKYIGKMLGWALRQPNYNLSLDLNVLFWKRILKRPISIEDLKHVEIYRYQMLQSVLDGSYECTFEADLGDGVEQPLCEGGESIVTDSKNCKLFVELYLSKYLQKDQIIYEAITTGVEETCPQQILRLLTAEQASETAFSSPKVTAEDFISRLKGGEDLPFPITRQLFDQMIREFSNSERQLLLKFITGSSRLGKHGSVYINYKESGSLEEFEEQEYLKYPERNPAHQTYPVGHTCGKSVDLPNYTDLRIMCERFRTAILTCGEIDDDGNYYGSENGEEGEDNSHNEGLSEGNSDDEDAEGESDSEDSGENQSNDDISQSHITQSVRSNISGAETSRQESASNESRSNSRSYNSGRRSSDEESFYIRYRDDNSSDEYGSESSNGEGSESENSNNSSSHSDSNSGSSESSAGSNSNHSDEESDQSGSGRSNSEDAENERVKNNNSSDKEDNQSGASDNVESDLDADDVRSPKTEEQKVKNKKTASDVDEDWDSYDESEENEDY